MIDFFRTGIVIQNDVTIVIDAASLTECYLLSRVLPLEVGIIRLVKASADIVAENGDGYVFRYVFQKRQRLDADIIVNNGYFEYLPCSNSKVKFFDLKNVE